MTKSHSYLSVERQLHQKLFLVVTDIYLTQVNAGKDNLGNGTVIIEMSEAMSLQTSAWDEMSALVIRSQEHKPAQANPAHAGNKPSKEPAIVKSTLAVREHSTRWIYTETPSLSEAQLSSVDWPIKLQYIIELKWSMRNLTNCTCPSSSTHLEPHHK